MVGDEPAGVGRLRSDVTETRMAIAAIITSEEVIRLRFNPPCASGFVSVSPSVAPSGRVRT